MCIEVKDGNESIQRSSSIAEPIESNLVPSEDITQNFEADMVDTRADPNEES